ncbi:hypothetical protein ACF0H5_001622 [Mactra antiquata]
MMSEFHYSYFRSEWQLRAGVLVWQIVSPILIIFGTTGNVISIKILSQRKFNRWASSIYLIGLAVADMCVLYVGLLRQWVKYTFDIDIRSLHPVICRTHWWLMYSCADIPVWILTAITIERLVSTLCPYKSKRICTKNKAKITLAVIVLVALLVNSHLVYGFGGIEIPNGNGTMYIPCAPRTEAYEHFFAKVWTWIDLCKFSLIPFAILSIGNACIIFKLVASRRKVRTSVRPLSTASTTVATSNKASNMTILLLSLNFIFIISTSPVCIYFIGESYWIPTDLPLKIRQQDPWWAFVNMLMFSNNSANFVLYCLTGSRFRESVKDLFKCEAGVFAVATGNTMNRSAGI